MDENKSDMMETAGASSPAEAAPVPQMPLTWRDGAIPLLALAMAAFYFSCFSLDNLHFPHLGVLAIVCLHFGAVLVVLGRKAHISAGSLFCTAAALAVAGSCALYASDIFLMMNCFVILFVAAMATFALSGHIRCGQARSVPGTVMLAVLALFTRIDRPFRSLRRLGRDRSGQGRYLLALLAAVPVVALVLWLLSSADAVFGSFFTGLDPGDLPELLWRAARTVVLALCIASALWFIREDAPAMSPPHEAKPRRAALFLPVTVLLDIVYMIFCYIQIKYLFGGAEEASMAGGWAEYARSGFFQLVAVAAINLGLCLAGTDEARFTSRGGKLLRAGFALLLALTAVILLSAFWRMRLYILAFGMSVLRLLTLWAMAVAAVGLLAAGWKLIRPGFGFFRVAGGFALGLWCFLCLANPCGMIARYNVDGYVSGALSQLDTDYLRRLGCDVLPALPPLQTAGPEGQAAFDQLIRQLSRPDRSEYTWAQQSLSGYRARLSGP